MEDNLKEVTTLQPKSPDFSLNFKKAISKEISPKRAVEDLITQNSQKHQSEEVVKNEEITEVSSASKEPTKFDKGIRFSKQNDKGTLSYNLCVGPNKNFLQFEFLDPS